MKRFDDWLVAWAGLATSLVCIVTFNFVVPQWECNVVFWALARELKRNGE